MFPNSYRNGRQQYSQYTLSSCPRKNFRGISLRTLQTAIVARLAGSAFNANLHQKSVRTFFDCAEILSKMPTSKSEQTIEVPPLEIKGIFMPLVGKSPKTIEAFQKTSKPSKTAKPEAR